MAELDKFSDLDEILSEEVKEVKSRFALACKSDVMSEVSGYLRQALGIMKQCPKAYNFQAVQRLVAVKLLEDRKISFPKGKRELEKEIDSAIFTYREVLNGLVEEAELKKSCFEKLVEFGYGQIYGILNDLSEGKYNIGFLHNYGAIKQAIGELKGRDEPIKIEAGIDAGKDSNEIFYKYMLKGMMVRLENGSFALGKLVEYKLLVKYYDALKKGFEQAEGRLYLYPEEKEEGKKVLSDSFFYICWGTELGVLANELNQEARVMELGLQRSAKERMVSDIRDYRKGVLEKVQDFLYEKAEETGKIHLETKEEEKKAFFDIVARSYIQFTSQFYGTLEETGEEAEKEMKKLENQYFKPKVEAALGL